MSETSQNPYVLHIYESSEFYAWIYEENEDGGYIIYYIDEEKILRHYKRCYPIFPPQSYILINFQKVNVKKRQTQS